MAEQKDFTAFRGDHNVLRFVMTTNGSIAGWTSQFTARRTDKSADPPILSGDGVVIDPGSLSTPGKIDVDIPRADFLELALRKYAYSFVRTNQGTEKTLTYGIMTVKSNILDEAAEATVPPTVPSNAVTVYQLIEDLGGDRNGFMQPVSPDIYPPGATLDILAPGSWPVVLNRLNLYRGDYYFECSARVAAVGARVAVALFDLGTDTFIPGSEMAFPADETIGVRQRSQAIVLPAVDTLIGVKLTTDDVSIGGAAWGCRIVRA
jgi:hypothetical protein